MGPTYDYVTRRSNWRELYAQTVGRGAGSVFAFVALVIARLRRRRKRAQ